MNCDYEMLRLNKSNRNINNFNNNQFKNFQLKLII